MHMHIPNGSWICQNLSFEISLIDLANRKHFFRLSVPLANQLLFGCIKLLQSWQFFFFLSGPDGYFHIKRPTKHGTGGFSLWKRCFLLYSRLALTRD